MSEPRRPDHPVAPMFPERWSPRAFTDAALAPDQMMSLLEAARWAPSASNHQPWRFVWALRDDGGHAGILAALAPGNQVWAGKAAALIVVASRDVTERDGVESPNRWAAFDSGAAWMSLALQAEAMGLAAHAMGGFDAPQLAAAIGLPANHSLHAVVAVGHRGPAGQLPDALQAREFPSQRRPLDQTAFRGRFGG